MLECPLYLQERKILFENVGEIMPEFLTKTKTDKFALLMSYHDGDYEICKLVSDFIFNNANS